MIAFTASAVGRSVGRLTFSPDSQILAMRDAIGITSLRAASSGAELVSKRVGTNKSFGFWGGPKQRTLFAYSYHKGVVPLDPDRKTTLPVIDGSTELIEPAFSPDGTRAVSKLRGSDGTTLTAHTISPRSVRKAWTRRPTDPVGKLSGVEAREFLPDGDRFLVSSSRVDGTYRERLMICRWSDKADRMSCDAPPHFIYGVLSPDGSRLACTCFESPTVYIYEVANLTRPPEQYRVPKKRHLSIGAYHPSGEFLAAVGQNDVLFLDARTFRVTQTYDWRIDRVHSVAFSPDGLLAAASGETGRVVVWDVDI
jgi:WD40 repeat protein